MMFRFACIAAVVAAYEDETTLLSARNMKVQDDLKAQVSQQSRAMTEADHQALSAACIAAFGEDAADACSVCKAKATAYIVKEGHHASLQSGAYLTEILGCMAGQGALPAHLVGIQKTCMTVFDASAAECVQASAQCFASHQSETCSLDNLVGCLDDTGFMACAAHKFEYKKCHDNVNGVGHCMVCSNDCLQGKVPTTEFLETESFGQCIAECAKPQSEAEGCAATICSQYYPNNLHKCIGCAVMSKGETQCSGTHCLKLPAFVTDQITCMWESANGNTCDSVVPAPYRGAEVVCEAAYGHLEGGTRKCIQAGAHCLALHPCECIDSCSQHNGWFDCFAHEMEFTECNDHPSGVAKCMTCGAKCLMQEQCGNPADCMNDPNFISCHRGCASCATSD